VSFVVLDEGEKCIPEKKCSCVSSADGERTIKCENYSDFFDAEIIECPSVCPKTPPANGDVCDIDYRIQCVYGDAVICDGDPDYMFPYENEMLLVIWAHSRVVAVFATPVVLKLYPRKVILARGSLTWDHSVI
jgi:hypothetical protein